jgi:hypothetical protein
MKQAHHRGTYHRRSLALVAQAYANPDTRCAYCGKTLAQHPRTRTGRLPRWSAGHVVKGQVDGALVPEVLSCNVRRENEHRNAVTRGNASRKHTRRRW